MTTYQPKGHVVPFIEAIKADPHRVWSSSEAAEVMKIQVRRVSATVKYPIAAGLIHKGCVWGAVAYSGMPFATSEQATPGGAKHAKRRKREPVVWTPDPDDLRIPRVVPGWVPPKMVCAREGC